MSCIVSPSALYKSSLMSVVQCFVSAAVFSPAVPYFPRPSPLPVSHTRCTGTCNMTCTCACMHTHTHTPPACHLVVSLISSSLVVFAPSFSAFNSASYPSFSRSLHPRPWPHPTEPSIQPFSSWMQILECDKSFWFLSSHFAVATESKTLNTAPTLPWLFTEPSMHTHTATKMHTDKRMHTRIHICMYASVHRLIHRHTGKPGPI